MTDLESQPISVKMQREREDLIDAFSEVMQSASGKRVIFWLLERCNVYGEVFSSDHAVTSYNLGRRSIGREVLTMLDSVDPRLYPRLLLDIAEMNKVKRAVDSAIKEDTDEAI